MQNTNLSSTPHCCRNTIISFAFLLYLWCTAWLSHVVFLCTIYLRICLLMHLSTTTVEKYEKLIVLYNHIAHWVVFNSISQVIKIQSIIYPKRLWNESVHHDNCTELRTEEAGDLMMRSELTLQDVPDGVAGQLRGCKGDEGVRAGTHEQPAALQMSALRRPVQRRLPLTVHRTDLNTNGNTLPKLSFRTPVSHIAF